MSSLLKISVSSLFIFLSAVSSGNDPYRFNAGAAEAGMGYSCITLEGFWRSFHNQALLAFNNTYSAGFSYENRYELSELSTRSAAFTVPAGRASLGVVYSHFGYSDFRRDIAGLACGLRLSEKLAAGIQADYFSAKTYGEYDDNMQITCEAGLLARISDNISIGVHIFNPVPGSLRKESMPSALRIGAGTRLNKSVSASAEAEMNSYSSLVFRCGFEFEAMKKLWLRGGFCTDNNSFGFGMGYLAKPVLIDLGFSTHDRLGICTSVSAVFNFGRRHGT